MGYSLSWLAVKGKPSQVVLDELGFRRAGEGEKIPEANLSAVVLPNGWFLMVANREEQVIPDELLQPLSADCEAVTCFVEEHVMFSSASGWRSGHKQWEVIDNSQKRHDHLETQGTLPPMFDSVLNALKLKQEEADAKKQNVDFIFDAPVELAYRLTGYRPDKDIPGLSDEDFEALVGRSFKTAAGSRSLADKWMALAGWQRRVFGALIIVGAFIIIICVATLIGMLLAHF